MEEHWRLAKLQDCPSAGRSALASKSWGVTWPCIILPPHEIAILCVCAFLPLGLAWGRGLRLSTYLPAPTALRLAPCALCPPHTLPLCKSKRDFSGGQRSLRRLERGRGGLLEGRPEEAAGGRKSRFLENVGIASLVSLRPWGALGISGGLFLALQGPSPGRTPLPLPFYPGVDLIGMARPIRSGVELRCGKAPPVQFTLVVHAIPCT